MNQREAFKETLALAEERGMPELPGTDLGLAHLRSMAERITPEFSESKLGRWLGWAQCALVAAGVGVTLEDVKRINVGHAVESLPLDPVSEAELICGDYPAPCNHNPAHKKGAE